MAEGVHPHHHCCCRVRDFLRSLGVSAVQHPGVEGDDIIASVALSAAEEPGVEARRAGTVPNLPACALPLLLRRRWS